MLGFRVWDSEIKRMRYLKGEFLPGEWAYAVTMNGELINTNDPIGIRELTNNLTPMQSTGLKDCNDVEIFEGDIIEFYTDCEDELQFLEVKNVTSFLIEAGEYQACMENDEIGFSEYTTVTGNIYENPELLEKLK